MTGTFSSLDTRFFTQKIQSPFVFDTYDTDDDPDGEYANPEDVSIIALKGSDGFAVGINHGTGYSVAVINPVAQALNRQGLVTREGSNELNLDLRAMVATDTGYAVVHYSDDSDTTLPSHRLRFASGDTTAITNEGVIFQDITGFLSTAYGASFIRLNDGRFAATWVDDASGSKQVKFALADSALSIIGKAVTLGVTADPASSHPNVVQAADGKLIVSWGATAFDFITSTNTIDMFRQIIDPLTYNGDGTSETWLGGTLNDTLTGNGGNDTLDGGNGSDTAKFAGAWTDYLIGIAAGTVTVADRVAARDGTDTIRNVEFFNFGGTIVAAASLLNVVPSGTDDENSVVEGTSANPGTPTASGNALANDTDPNVAVGDTKAVTGIRLGTEIAGGTFSAAGTTIVGIYGALTLQADGSYVYQLDNADPDTDALKAGQSGTDTFTYRVADAAGLVDTAQITVTVAGASGNTIIGTSGNDKINLKKGVAGKTATNEDDTINGKGGNDKLDAAGGDDIVKGGKGHDTITGGLGLDTLRGNDGRDVFVFKTAPGVLNMDTIADFKHGTDHLQLSKSVFPKIGRTLDADEFFAKKGAVKAHDRDDRIIYDTKSGKLFFDEDGKKSGHDAVLFATLSNKPALDADDFVIV
jgi:VCBS repeat-containing protein